MAVIYTISHPFTNEVVYVGCCNSLNHRSSVHTNSKTNSDVSKWIQQLRYNYMLPKIEMIDICDSDDCLYFEEYWIHQLTVWGFNLLNKNKTIKLRKSPKKYFIKKERVASVRQSGQYVKKTTEQWNEERRIRLEQKAQQKALKKTQRKYKWSVSSFDDGKIYEVEINKLRSFKEMLRQYIKYFNLERHFTSIVNDDKVVITIHNGKRIFLPDYGRTKKGSKRYKPLLPKKIKQEPEIKEPKLQRYHFKSVSPGDSIFIKKERLRSFMTMQAFYNRNNEKKVYYNKSEIDGKIRIDFVEQKDQGRRTRIDDATAINIYNDTRPIIEISKAFGFSYSVIWNIKKGRFHSDLTKHNQTS